MRRNAAIGGFAVIFGLGLAWAFRGRGHVATVNAPTDAFDASASEGPRGDAGDRGDRLSFIAPHGEPTALSCASARAIVAEVRSELAYRPDAVDVSPFAASVSDWVDPHGLWSLAPDAPASKVVREESAAMLRELESEDVNAPCPASVRVGRALSTWVASLALRFDEGRDSVRIASSSHAASPLSGAPPPGAHDAGAEFPPALAAAFDLGVRVKGAELANPLLHPYAESSRARFFPPKNAEEWAEVVLSAAVRAYVPLIDPHGAWAPLDEAASIYEVDLVAHAPEKPWESAVVAPLGAGIDVPNARELRAGDVVLELDGTKTQGMPIEQLDQLAFSAFEDERSPIAVILRDGEISKLQLSRPRASGMAADEGDESPRLEVERVAYGEGDVAVVPIRDVRDDLGEQVARVLRDFATASPGTRPVVGVVLDLRGNGGGSTDAAQTTIASFLGDVPLFPTHRRDGTIEIERSFVMEDAPRWEGPVATFVDRGTASAGEMIAGALTAYHRGPSVGVRTYGKGCAQEYLDDAAKAGVLRLTSLLYALPDGAAVQRTGLTPTLSFPWRAPEGEGEPEREATLLHAPPSWKGPDVRMASRIRTDWGWTPPHGAIGPCRDTEVCRALRLLGTLRRGPVAKSR